jgi:hypothetical protein
VVIILRRALLTRANCYFPNDAPSRIFMFIHSWPGPFDLKIDCVAAQGIA